MILDDKEIIVKDSLFNPQSSDRKIYYKDSPNGKRLYKVYIYLEGSGISFVDNVVYKLHQSFDNPEIKINRTITNSNCILQIWTWGLFNLDVNVYFQTGEMQKIRYYTTYDKDLNNNSSYEEERSFA